MGLNGTMMRNRRQQMIGESNNQKKRKKDREVSVILLRFVAKNSMIYDAIRKWSERNAKAYFARSRAGVLPL